MCSVTYKNNRHILPSLPGITWLSNPYSRLRSGYLYDTVCATFILSIDLKGANNLAKHKSKIGLHHLRASIPYLDWSAENIPYNLYGL